MLDPYRQISERAARCTRHDRVDISTGVVARTREAFQRAAVGLSHGENEAIYDFAF